MGFLIKTLMKVAANKFLRGFEKANEYPYESQEELLLKLIKRNEKTIFGKKYGFKEIKDVESYQTKMPLLNYSDYRPYIKLILQNKHAVLTMDKVIYLAQTSGTTGTPKILPLSKNSIKEFGKMSARIFTSYISEHPENQKVLDGKFLLFMAPAVDYTIHDLPVGYISGINAAHQNKLFQKMVVPPYEIINEKDWNLKFYKTAQIAIKHDITLAGGVTPLLLSLLQKISDEIDNPLISDYIKFDTSKIQGNSTKSLSKIWPNFKVLLHSGVHVKPYLNWMNELFDEEIDFRDNYGATEGVFGFQRGETNGIQLNLDTYFFEFIRESDLSKEFPKRYFVDQLRVGGTYAIVITNSSGLYSYLVSDIIRVIKTEPLMITIVGRKGCEINLAGEKMTEEKLSEAIYEAMKINYAPIREFTTAPVYSGGLKYRFLVEFKKQPTNPIQFLRDLDSALATRNKIYRSCREMGLIQNPELVILPRGAYQKYCELKAAEGKPIGQMKTSHITSNKYMVDEIISDKPLDILSY
ncbi:MAG: GH3 family domain-containing protein [Candidatus Odinarchaeia archaeon]